MGVTNLSCGTGCSGGSAITIQDDLTGTPLSDVYVGMYAVGQPLVGSATGYSRFTTSLNLPSWLTGTTPPGNSCPSGATGSFYSCTTTSNNCGTGTTKTLWACVGQTWVGIK